MTWLVGLDEAGYGPNLGPLVIGATAWRVGDGNASPPDLYELLKDAVTREADGTRVAIADSKTLYKPGGGLALLERGVHAACTTAGCWSELVAALGADPDGKRENLPWHQGFDPSLPRDASLAEVANAATQLHAACAAADVEPPLARARLVFPEEFNTLVDRYGTKGAALSHVTIGLLREVIDSIKGDATDGDPMDGPVECVLDKHGGRNRYAALLQHHFPESWIETVEESRTASRYAWSDHSGPVRATFKTGGESFLPTALASMTAKYLRELAMQAFNAYWQAQVPGIRPTAGYPVDAKRFKNEIASKQAELRIDDKILWRTR